MQGAMCPSAADEGELDIHLGRPSIKGLRASDSWVEEQNNLKWCSTMHEGHVLR